MPNKRFHRFEHVNVGMESNSGLAVAVEIGGEWTWVPLSLVANIKRDPKTHDNDEITVEEWWAKKEGLI